VRRFLSNYFDLLFHFTEQINDDDEQINDDDDDDDESEIDQS